MSTNARRPERRPRRTGNRPASRHAARDRSRTSAHRASATARTRRRASSRRRARRLTGAAVALLAVLVIVVAIVAVGILSTNAPTAPADTRTASDSTDAVFSNPLDWSNLSTDDKGRLAYVVNGEKLSRVGVDVSSHQGQIDWQQVAADGIGFAYVRVGYRGSSSGQVQADDRASENISGARDAGLSVGAYFYSQATTEDEAREEADFVAQSLAGTQLDLPVAFDHERSADGTGRADDLSGTAATLVARAFCDQIRKAGYEATVYGNAPDLARFDLTQLPEGLWLAQYAARPTTSLRFAYWQFSNVGQVAGISTNVDLDLDLTVALARADAGA